ncbi:uncharacterized protein LOC126732977 isoform X2 [Quercus robur]|uniref:uncharacterized protein LOC126732977 isoform X2 n=1 Tax=Quercus robur TaxID=38942 RepID=UPI002162C22F|nr:uncharacterized protein LOC126732977 isoform X2 [Quercus robur]
MAHTSFVWMRWASPSFAFSLIMMGHDNNNTNNNGSAFAFLQSHVKIEQVVVESIISNLGHHWLLKFVEDLQNWV